MPSVILVGDQGSGKTGLYKRFVDDDYSDNERSTIGLNSNHKTVELNGRNEQVVIWDTTGQKQFIGLIHGYIRNKNIIVINVDLAAAMATTDPKGAISKQIKTWKEMCDQLSPNAVFLLALNKADLAQIEQNLLDTIRSEAMENGMKAVFVTSAKNNDGVTALFNYAAEIAPASEQTFQTEPVIIGQDYSDTPMPDIDKEIAIAKRRKFLTGARNFLLGLLIIGAVVGLVLLFVFPPAGLATLLATTVVGSLTVGAVAGIGVAALAALAFIGTAVYSFFKRSNTEPKEEKPKELVFEMAAEEQPPAASTNDLSNVIGAFPKGLPGQQAGDAASRASVGPPATNDNPQFRK